MVLCCRTDIAGALLVVGVTWVNPNLINIKDFFVKYNLIPVLSSYWDLCMPARLFSMRLEQSLNKGKDKSDKDKCKTKTSPMKADGPVKVSTLSPGPKAVTKQKKTATDNTATLAGQVPPPSPPTIQDTTVTDKTTSSQVAKTTPLKMTPPAQSLTPTYIPASTVSTIPSVPGGAATG